MDRSIYADGIVVDRTALERTELTKAAEILRGRLDWTSCGIYTGGITSVAAADNTRVDIASFTGYVPNGEFIECLGNLASVQLADDALNAVNYVCAFYTETEDLNQPHETDAQVYPTRAVRSYRIQVYEESVFAALPYTDANLANDSRDRALLLSTVVANGSGIALTASSITSPTVFENILYSSPKVFIDIPGVEVIGVSSDTPVGLGTVDFVYSAPNYTLQWTSLTGGAGVAVTTNSDGDYQLFDGGGAAYILVRVSVSMLPTTTPHSATANIINLYGQDIPRQTAEDDLHRNMLGTGVPSPSNPHGTSLDDISEESLSLLDEHQDIMHCNGIWKGSSSSIFTTSVTSSPPNDTLHVVAPTGSDLYYVNGKKLNTLDITDIVFNFPTNTTHLYEILVSDEATLEYNLKASYPLARTVSGTWIVDMSDEYTAGTYTLQCVATAGVPNTYAFSWDGGQVITVDGGTSDHAIRLYSSNGVDWIDLWVRSSAVGATDDFLPATGATYADSVAVAASLDAGENMTIASVVYWYNSSSGAGLLGYPPYLAGRNALDTRIWGTLCTENMRDSALQAITYAQQDEYHVSGVLLGRDLNFHSATQNFDLLNTVALTTDVMGGHVYCRGQRLSVEESVGMVLADNTTSIVYVDYLGVLQSLDVNAVFSGNVYWALRYLLGSTEDRPAIAGLHYHADASLSDTPERGVPLWEIITSGGAITSTRDMMRNVNGALEPWSVASRTSCPAAFDTLYAAFQYATALYNIVQDVRSVEVLVVGTTEVDWGITQPVSVNVRGTGAQSRVNINYVDLAGAWRLATGNSVSYVHVLPQVNDTAVFGLAREIKVKECTHYRGVGVTGDYFFGSGVGAVADGFIEGNWVNTEGAFFEAGVAANTLTRFNINKNIVTMLGDNPNAATDLGLIRLMGVDCHICDNTLVTDNSNGNFIAAIHLSSAMNCVVDQNIVSIGEGDATAREYGIQLDSSSYIGVERNHVQRVSGSSSEVGVGVSVLTVCTSCQIDNNTIQGMNCGVAVTGWFSGLSISHNNISDSYWRGVYIEPSGALSRDLTVNSNTILGVVRNSILLGDGVAAGIQFNRTTSPFNFVNASISDNDISGVTGALSVYGIYWSDNTVVSVDLRDNIKIDNNRMFSLIGGPTREVAGIKLSDGGTGIVTNLSVSSNQIVIDSAVPVGSVGIPIGIYASYRADNATVDGNNIRVREVAADTDTGEGIRLMGVWRCASVSDNTLFVLTSGIRIEVFSGLISANNIHGTAVGVTLEGTLGDNTLIGSNVIEIYAYRQNPHGGIGNTGSYGIMIDSGNEGVSVVANKIRLRGTGSPDNLFDQSACIYAVNNTDLTISDNDTRILTVQVNGGAASAANFAAHIYVRLLTGSSSMTTIKNNYIHNIGPSGAVSQCNGIATIKSGPYTGTEVVCIHSIGNTVYGSNIEGGAVINNDAGTYPPPNYPYELFYYTNDGVSPPLRNMSVIQGNALYIPSNIAAIPRILYQNGTTGSNGNSNWAQNNGGAFPSCWW